MSEKFTLEKVTIAKELWGDNKGKYKGEIKFSNGVDSFTFELNETLAKLYLNLIKDTVVSSANQLGDKLIDSLNESTKFTNE